MADDESTVMNNNNRKIIGCLTIKDSDTDDNTHPHIKVYSKYFTDIIPVISNRAVTMMALLMPYIFPEVIPFVATEDKTNL